MIKCIDILDGHPTYSNVLMFVIIVTPYYIVSVLRLEILKQ